MFNLTFPKYLLCVPAILLALVIYSIGINTFTLTNGCNSYETDGPGPAMQLNDISKGFARDTAARPFSMFHSMVISSVYVPYIWARSSVLPPYDLKMLDAGWPTLMPELVFLARLMNVIAALGILIIAFYLMCLLTKGSLPPLLVSLAVALNPNLMFQASVTYYENWSFFWVMLSVLCFVKIILNKKNSFFWLSGFFIIAAFAVSTHERMLGYYIFAAPFLVYKFYVTGLRDKDRRGKTVLFVLAALSLGTIAFCLANNVFGYGFGPILEYLRYKSPGIKTTPDRMSGLLAFLKNQVRCHAHTIWLVFWNSGAILPFFSLYGVAAIWKKRFYPALSLLLFPIGYQVLSVGLPGWTSGRYILGQVIFALLFAGFGIAYFTYRAKNNKKAGIALVLFCAALMSEALILSLIKVADIYYHPYRVVEGVARDPASQGKKIAIQGLRIYSKDDFYWVKNIKYELIPEGEKRCPDADIIISTDKDGCSCNKIRKEVFRSPPGWLLFLVKRQCYVYSQGLSTIRIQWCDREQNSGI